MVVLLNGSTAVGILESFSPVVAHLGAHWMMPSQDSIERLMLFTAKLADLPLNPLF